MTYPDETAWAIQVLLALEWVRAVQVVGKGLEVFGIYFYYRGFYWQEHR
jgi:hypothetical protein